MPNQLAIPFKQSYKATIKQAVRDYIRTRTDFHPDVFKWDINRWESLREESRGGIAHVDRIKPSIKYEHVWAGLFNVI
jgi:programmed cell death 6-interacting protein